MIWHSFQRNRNIACQYDDIFWNGASKLNENGKKWTWIVLVLVDSVKSWKEKKTCSSSQTCVPQLSQIQLEVFLENLPKSQSHVHICHAGIAVHFFCAITKKSVEFCKISLSENFMHLSLEEVRIEYGYQFLCWLRRQTERILSTWLPSFFFRCYRPFLISFPFIQNRCKCIWAWALPLRWKF